MTHFDTNGAPDYRDSPAPTYQQVIARDPIEAPASLRQIHPTHIEMPRVPRERYTSQTFFDLEKERMWSRTWQVACRVEEVREVGDCVLYDSPGASLIIMRSAPDVIKAFYNGCLHRGMKLCASDTSVNKIRCPYHGMTWNLDGSLQNLPARWDFDPVEDSELALPEARVGLWGGFVFVNRDPASPSLETYLGPLIAEFADWSRDDVYLDTRVTKVMEANWKCCIEGFVEAFHVAELRKLFLLGATPARNMTSGPTMVMSVVSVLPPEFPATNTPSRLPKPRYGKQRSAPSLAIPITLRRCRRARLRGAIWQI